MSGNYSSSNSSTTSSTHSNGKSNTNTNTNTNKYSSTSHSSRNDIPPSAMDTSMKKPNPSEKMPVKKLANKSTQVESPPPTLKTFSLSDSETCNTNKMKQLPPNDYFRFPKSKATSSPVISMNSPSLPTTNNSPKRMISHSFLAAIDKDTFKKAINPEQPEHHTTLSYEKPEKSSFDQNSLSFPHNQRTNFPVTARYISTGSMLTEEMLLNGSLNRFRYMNPQNMQMLSDPNAWATAHMATAECFLGSPSRTKNFASSVAQPKRR